MTGSEMMGMCLRLLSCLIAGVMIFLPTQGESVSRVNTPETASANHVATKADLPVKPQSNQVFDLIFWQRFAGVTASDIQKPLDAAARLSKSLGRGDLQLLCKAAASGKLDTFHAGGSGQVRQFLSACRSFDTVRRSPAMPAEMALRDLSASESVLRGLRAEIAVALVQRTIGDIYLFSQSRDDLAEPNYEQSLAIFARNHLDLSQAEVYANLGYLYQEQQMLPSAEAHYRVAGERCASAGRLDAASQHYVSASECAWLAGDRHLALQDSEVAVTLAGKHFVRRGASKNLVGTLCQAAEIIRDAGDNDRQLSILRRASDWSRMTGDFKSRIQTLRRLSSALEESGDSHEVAVVTAEIDRSIIRKVQALRKTANELSASGKKDARIPQLLLNLGWALKEQGDSSEAAVVYGSAAKWLDRTGNPGGSLKALMAERDCARDESESLRLTLQIAEKAESLSLWDEAATEMLKLARDKDPDAEQAKQYFARAASDARRGDDVLLLVQTLAESGEFLADNGQTQEALSNLREAARLSKEVRLDQVLLDRLYDCLCRVETDRSLLDEWTKRATRSSPGRLVSEKWETTVLASGRGEVFKWLDSLLSSREPSPGVDFHYVARRLDDLPTGYLYIQYYATQTRFYALVWKQEKCAVIDLGQRSNLNERLDRLRQSIMMCQADVASGLSLNDLVQSDHDLGGLRDDLTAIYDVMIAPIESWLGGRSRLLVGLPLELGWVPLHAAVSRKSGQSLIDGSAVSYVRPAVCISGSNSPADARNRRLNNPVVFAADAQIAPASEQETRAIAKSFPSARCYRAGAAAKSLVNEVASASCIHIAAHYSRSEQTLKFGPDTGDLVRLDDILNASPSDLDLVTLSCCESAGALSPGVDGGTALVDAFGLLGARTVVATLWQVSDKASAEFSAAFYSELAAGRDKGEAFRAAVLSLRKSKSFGHPFYWAAFALYGDPL